MLTKMFQSVFGSRNTRVLKRLSPIVAKINALEPDFQALSDEALRAKTAAFRTRFQQGETLDQLLPEAFATVRETSRRVLNMRHFDVQLIGGMVLHQGAIAEMRTGEGKTLMATLPAYLNALTGQGVHIVTTNDYLAARDAHWMSPIYEFLGISVGVILSDQPPVAKRAAYMADITFGTNNEFGFDYLRDNMAFDTQDRMQQPLHYAIVDEVDSILIDEARTPLIISGPAEDSSALYLQANRLIPTLKRQSTEDEPGDFLVDEKTRQVYLTEEGHQKVESLLTETGLLQTGDSLYSANNITLMHHIYAALRAHTLYHRDIDYIVREGEVVIVDEHTGRTMPGRRWSEGLHQAVEAKENVTIKNENQTLASITFQNYFRLYEKLAGMTGTADTEAYEFQQIYGLEVLVIPTNKPMIRKDLPDMVYLKATDKYQAIIRDIKDCVTRQQPVLVGTASIETSEYVSQLLKKEKIPHQVLNAKYHEKEAQIIAEAGRPGTVTIATNMAGRGTDIVLGGSLETELAALGDTTTPEITTTRRQEWQIRHDQVLTAGGLHIIGTERHESRRIDNQLRGRSGRQGDPGSTRFYLSLEDNLMRIFASDRIAGLMGRLGMDQGIPIEHPWVTKAIETAQRKVEGRNFDIRKQLLEYDDVANEQRKVIYTERNALMSQSDVSATITTWRERVLVELIDEYIPPHSLEEQWDIPGLDLILENDFSLHLHLNDRLKQDTTLHEETLRQLILAENLALCRAKEEKLGSEVMRHFEKSVMLQCLDNHWREHLSAMEHLRQGIHLRGYAQKDPRQEYKRESFLLFTKMLDNVKYAVISLLSVTEIRAPSDVDAVEAQRRSAVNLAALQYEHALANTAESSLSEEEVGFDQHTIQTQTVTPAIRTAPKVGRNEPCPCGSGKKYKHCHGQVA